MRRKFVMFMLTAVMALGSVGPVSVVSAATPFDGEEWYDQISTVQVNREPAHTFFVPYQDAQTGLENEHSALTRDFARSDYYESLNGEWDFKWVAKPADRIEGFDEPQYDVSGWDKIPVPSSWQTIRNDDGSIKYDTPIYSNQRYPWRNYESLTLPSSSTSTASVAAPLKYNPVGHYRRTFDLPENWDGREVFVSFQGVESCVYVWVNGHYVGYATDSFTASDFNITKYLKPGKNLIAAQVYRWSIASYVENQDMIRLSGIFRDVFLYSKDKVELRDFFVKTKVLDSGSYDDFKLELESSVRNFGSASGTYKLEATLKNMDNTDVWADGPLVLDAAVAAASDKPANVTVSGAKNVIAPRKWFADSPNLYKLLLELKDPSGKVVETAVQRVGFRVIERNKYAGEKSVMQINGKDIMLRGVNRHEFSADYGHAITKEQIVTDLYLMKRANINAIRMSHYPNNVLTYDLADELGLYICDEANVESHEGSTSSKPIPSFITPGMNWNNSLLDRAQSMVERDKNHASVVIWSFGNEATYTRYALNENYTFYNMSNWIKQRDPSRLRKYERDNRDGLVDIHSVQYPNPSGAASGARATNMPYIMSEYEHAMGNSPGSFVEFWDVFRSIRNAQGGFGWDFIDQTIWMPTEKPANTYTVTSNQPALTVPVLDGAIAEGGGRNGGNALNGYITHEISPALNVNAKCMTVEAWVLPKAVAGNTEIVSKGESGFALKYNGANNFEFWVNGYGAGYINAAPPADWLNGTWKLLTAVYDGTKPAAERYQLYINGQLFASASRSSGDVADNNNGQGLTIGNSPSYPASRKFPGLIDSVRIYKTALTPEQIQDSTRSANDANVVYWNDFSNITSEASNLEMTDKTYYAYGGDWGETVHDGAFSGNGMVFADRTPKPYMTEVKYAHQEVWYKATADQLSAGQVQITNEHLNTNLNAFDHEWEILKDGAPLVSGSLNLSTAPLTTEIVTIPEILSIIPEPGAEYLLNLRAKTKTDQPWAAAGYAFATAQFKLPISVTDTENVFSAEDLPVFKNLTETAAEIVAEGADFSIRFDKVKAEITSIQKNNKELIASGPIIAHWRSPGDNDRNYNNSLKDTWGKAKITKLETALDETGKVMTVTVQSALAGSASNVTTYKILSNGEIIVKNKLQPAAGGGALLRVGMSMKLAEGLDNIEYYGRGPVENYSDRNVGTHAGIFKAKTQDQYVPYIRPQFYGNRTDVRWYSVTDTEGNGLLINGTNLLNASASHYDDLDFDGLKHMYLSPKLKTPILNIDMAQGPLGSAACGPAPLDKYILHPNKAYEYTYRIMPVTAADTAFKIEASKRAFEIAELPVVEKDDIGEAIWVGNSRIDARNGASGGVGSYKFGEITNGDDIIKLFYPEGGTVGTVSYINALDNPAGTSGWKGYLDISVKAPAAGKYRMNVLCYNNQQTRSLEATVNGLSQGVTPTIGEAVKYTAGNGGLRVLSLDAVLLKGANTIRLQAPSGGDAPNFVALCVTEAASTAYLNGKVEWVGSTKIANPNMTIVTGTSVAKPTAISPTPVPEAYDETIGWFFPDMNQKPAYTAAASGKYYINGIDNSNSKSWDGSVTVTVNVPKSGFYNLYDLIFYAAGQSGRTHEFTVNGASQGSAVVNGGLTPYTSGTSLAVLEKTVRLDAGDNTVKIQAQSGAASPANAAPAFVALAVVGYEPESKAIGEILKAGETGVELRNGVSGGLTVNGTFGNIQNYSANTVGLFMPEAANGDPVSYNSVGGLDRSSDHWRGHVNLFVDAETAGEYQLNILCSTGETGRKFDVTVNGEPQAQTEPTSNDTSRKYVYSTSASQAVNVLKPKVTLNAGRNIIRLQSPPGVAAPNFMAAVVTAVEPEVFGILDIETGEEVTVSVNVQEAGQMILAAYDENGELTAVAKENLAVGNQQYSFDMDLANAESISAFAWSAEYLPFFPAMRLSLAE